MPNQIQLKDAEQDREIALLKHRVEELEEGGVDELRQRVRKLEKTVWSASAVITALITIVGLMDALNAKEMDYGSNGTTQQEVVLQLPSS
jgi:fumarate hydratase class II